MRFPFILICVLMVRGGGGGRGRVQGKLCQGSGIWVCSIDLDSHSVQSPPEVTHAMTAAALQSLRDRKLLTFRPRDGRLDEGPQWLPTLMVRNLN